MNNPFKNPKAKAKAIAVGVVTVVALAIAGFITYDRQDQEIFLVTELVLAVAGVSTFCVWSQHKKWEAVTGITLLSGLTLLLIPYGSSAHWSMWLAGMLMGVIMASLGANLVELSRSQSVPQFDLSPLKEDTGKMLFQIFSSPRMDVFAEMLAVAFILWVARNHWTAFFLGVGSMGGLIGTMAFLHNLIKEPPAWPEEHADTPEQAAANPAAGPAVVVNADVAVVEPTVVQQPDAHGPTAPVAPPEPQATPPGGTDGAHPPAHHP